jgi:hypothetical protein
MVCMDKAKQYPAVIIVAEEYYTLVYSEANTNTGNR